MIETGTYQNNISELPTLNIGNYENIFKIFEASINDKNFYIFNILKKIEFPDIDQEYLQYYTPESKTALTILSHKLYGDITSWWIIYLLNKDKFSGAPFYIDGGVQVKYIIDEYRVMIYTDIINGTIYGGRHY
jgi:hypothetical protein